MKRVIVTGANGFVGNYLVEALLDQGTEVYAIIGKNRRDSLRAKPGEKLHKRFCCTTFGK